MQGESKGLVRGGTPEWERRARQSTEARYRGGKEEDECGKKRKHMGGDGWNPAAMLRSLGLTGIMEASEGLKQRRDRFRAVFNTTVSNNVRIMQGGVGGDVERLLRDQINA